MSISDDALLLKHLRDLPEMHSPLDVDHLGDGSLGRRPEEMPIKGNHNEKQ